MPALIKKKNLDNELQLIYLITLLSRLRIIEEDLIDGYLFEFQVRASFKFQGEKYSKGKYSLRVRRNKIFIINVTQMKSFVMSL